MSSVGDGTYVGTGMSEGDGTLLPGSNALLKAGNGPIMASSSKCPGEVGEGRAVGTGTSPGDDGATPGCLLRETVELGTVSVGRESEEGMVLVTASVGSLGGGSVASST